jgi:hypothetical protein
MEHDGDAFEATRAVDDELSAHTSEVDGNPIGNAN